MNQVLTQIWLMVDCLKKKIKALDIIIAITNKQTEVIINSPNDNFSFNELVEQKKDYINYINDLDNIFADIYERIKDYMGKGDLTHKEALAELQDNIRTVTDLTVKIKTLEEKNQRVLTGSVRRSPKRLVDPNHAVSAYKKNRKF